MEEIQYRCCGIVWHCSHCTFQNRRVSPVDIWKDDEMCFSSCRTSDTGNFLISLIAHDRCTRGDVFYTMSWVLKAQRLLKRANLQTFGYELTEFNARKRVTLYFLSLLHGFDFHRSSIGRLICWGVEYQRVDEGIQKFRYVYFVYRSVWILLVAKSRRVSCSKAQPKASRKNATNSACRVIVFFSLANCTQGLRQNNAPLVIISSDTSDRRWKTAIARALVMRCQITINVQPHFRRSGALACTSKVVKKCSWTANLFLGLHGPPPPHPRERL